MKCITSRPPCDIRKLILLYFNNDIFTTKNDDSHDTRWRRAGQVHVCDVKLQFNISLTSYPCPGYDVKLYPTVLHLLSSLCRSLWRSLAPLGYW